MPTGLSELIQSPGTASGRVPVDIEHFVNLAAMDGSEIFDPHQEARCPTLQDLRENRTEPTLNYLSNPNPSLCFHTVVAQCKETQLELPVVAQLD